jgi:hypothetical protein
VAVVGGGGRKRGHAPTYLSEMAESVRELLLDEDGRLMVGFFLASAFSMLCSNSAAATRSNSSFTLWSAFGDDDVSECAHVEVV